MCALFFIITSYLAPRDMKILRRQMQLRAEGLPAEPEKGPPGFVGFYVLCLILVGGFGLLFSVAIPMLGLAAFSTITFPWAYVGFFVLPLLTFALAWGVWTLKRWARFLVILGHSLGFLAGIAFLFSLIPIILPWIGVLIMILNGVVVYWFMMNGKYFGQTREFVAAPPDIQ